MVLLPEFRIVVLLCVLYYPVHGNVVETHCNPDEDVCEFHLGLYNHIAMLHYTDKGKSEHVEVLRFDDATTDFISRGGRKHDCKDFRSLGQDEVPRVVTGDGTFKDLILFNRSLPGPPIVVYHGQQVVVHVTNQLVNEATTVHFHGMYQRHTPWMDGAGGVSHCSIGVGETFTYRFKADPVGTHWYHSHYGVQRTSGAYGPLVVLDRSPAEQNTRRGPDPLPEFDEEFYLMVSDYFHRSSMDILMKVRNDASSFSHGYESPVSACYDSTKQADYLDCGVVPWDAGVINGKGRYYPDRTFNTTFPNLPLDKFSVKKGGKYRFRSVCASMSFAFKISIDGHRLHIIAVDGSDVVTKTVDSYVLFSGERVDFWIDASDPDKLGSYWIRAENLEYLHDNQVILPGHVEAVLQYDTAASDDDPVSEKPQCTPDKHCVQLGCPFKRYAPAFNTDCVFLTDLTSTEPAPLITPAPDQRLHEFFLNFHYAWANEWKPTVNGIQHRPTAAPPQVYPSSTQQRFTPCENATCMAPNICFCTHLLEVPLGAVVQLNLATTIYNAPGTLNGNSHQVHLHGTGFQVLKIEWPKYQGVSQSVYEGPTDDYTCTDFTCNELVWSNASWAGGRVPGLAADSPPVKDTVYVPVGGYVITRFVANNPGYWYMHCHTEFHNEEGMALIFKVGDDTEMNPPPAALQTCGNFHWDAEEFEAKVNFQSDGKAPKKKAEQKSNYDFGAYSEDMPRANITDDEMTKVKAMPDYIYPIALVGCVAIILCLAANSLVLYVRLRQYQAGYISLSSSDDFSNQSRTS